MKKNKKTIVFAIALLPSFLCSMELPRISDLCNAGAELFGCRQTKPGAELLFCCARNNEQRSFAQIKKEADHVNEYLGNDLGQNQIKNNGFALRQYEAAKVIFGTDSAKAEKYKPKVVYL